MRLTKRSCWRYEKSTGGAARRPVDVSDASTCTIGGDGGPPSSSSREARGELLSAKRERSLT